MRRDRALSVDTSVDYASVETYDGDVDVLRMGTGSAFSTTSLNSSSTSRHISPTQWPVPRLSEHETRRHQKPLRYLMYSLR